MTSSHAGRISGQLLRQLLCFPKRGSFAADHEETSRQKKRRMSARPRHDPTQPYRVAGGSLGATLYELPTHRRLLPKMKLCGAKHFNGGSPSTVR